MEYTTSVPFSGVTSTAIERARFQLMANGFRLDHVSEAQLVATGPGMRNTNQDPILGATRIAVTVSKASIGIQAELGGVKFMQRFIFLFPPALGALVFLSPLFFLANVPRNALLLALAPFLPWAILAPLMARWIKTRTTKALDTFVHNMAVDRETG